VSEHAKNLVFLRYQPLNDKLGNGMAFGRTGPTDVDDGASLRLPVKGKYIGIADRLEFFVYRKVSSVLLPSDASCTVPFPAHKGRTLFSRLSPYLINFHVYMSRLNKQLCQNYCRNLHSTKYCHNMDYKLSCKDSKESKRIAFSPTIPCHNLSNMALHTFYTA
jgi:hypothetical protein